MLGLPLSLITFAHGLHGVVSSPELAGLGITPHQRKALVAAGLLTPVFPGVYRLAGAVDTVESRCRAVCLACGEAVITGRAAGALWGLRRMGRVDVIEARVPHFAQSFRSPTVRLRRCNHLPAGDIVHRPDGIRVVSAARLPFDLAADLSRIDLVSVIEQVLDQDRCTISQLLDVDQRLFHPARPGSRQYRSVIRSRPVSGGSADSHLEVVLHEALVAAGVRGLVRQHPITVRGGIVLHPDLAVPALRWAVEVDHTWWHQPTVAVRRDKERDRLTAAEGWVTSRVADDDITADLSGTVAELLAVHRRLRAAARPASDPRAS